MSTTIQYVGNPIKPRLESIRMVRPGKLTITYIAEAISVNSVSAPTPDAGGASLESELKLVRKQADRSPDGYYVIRWVYEAGCKMPGLSKEEAPLWKVSASLIEAPLASHPKFEDIRKKYGGYLMYGQVMFPPQDPTNSSNRSGTDSQGNNYGNVNPFYNVDSFLSPRVVIRKTEMKSGNDLPVDELKGLGLISSPDGGPSGLTGGTNFIKSGASARQHGNDLEVEYEWMSGGIGGWKEVIYSPGSEQGL